MIHLRSATQSDQPTITRLIHDVGINPMSLDWHHFLIAEENGQTVGIGQVKQHSDGSRELASIAVIPERRRQGIASEIIRALLARESGDVYLTCHAHLETFYKRFGFYKIGRAEMPSTFRRMIPIVNWMMRITRTGIQILVMKRSIPNEQFQGQGQTSLKQIPETKNALVLRTDFSDDAAWANLCWVIQQPVGSLGFRAYVDFVSDRAYDGLTVEQLPARLYPGSNRNYMFIVDRTALSHPEHPILVVDLYTEVGRTFRVIPSEMWGVENNLSIANMDFAEFADAVDPDGIFRGFPVR